MNCKRFPVPDERVRWSGRFGYKPIFHVDAHVLANAPGKGNGWADEAEPVREQIERRGSHELLARNLQWQYDENGWPLNPRARTGMKGRGKLGKWGPNHAGDAVMTATSAARQKQQQRQRRRRWRRK